MSALTKWNPFRTASEIEERGPLALWEPFREMERSFNRLERLFGRMPGNGEREAMIITEWSPSVDISEDDKEFLVKQSCLK